MTQRTILAVFAHPDDEVMSGGTLARYAAGGARVVLACATRGEVGEISDPALATPETLGEVRTQELRAAAAALGLAEVRHLGYHDSGMAGTPQNEDPRSLPKADPAAATRHFVELIREVRPDVVITHDPTGGYGHPDHIAVWRYTEAAFDLAGDPAQHPEAGEPWRPSRLYYGVMARSFFRTVGEAMRAAGVDTSPFDRPEMANLGYEDDQITATVDVSGLAVAKRAAVDAHRTQFGQDSPMRKLPEEVQRSLWSQEHFVLVRPALGEAAGDEVLPA